MRIWVCKSHN